MEWSASGAGTEPSLIAGATPFLSSTQLFPGLRLSALSALSGLCLLCLLPQAAWLGTQPGKPLPLCMPLSRSDSPGASRHLLSLILLITAEGYCVCSQ